MKSIRSMVLIASAVLLTSVLSGCVVRPLWWGGHGAYGHRDDGQSGPHSDRRNRDGDRRESNRR